MKARETSPRAANRPRRLSMTEVLTTATVQDHKDLSTPEIQRRRNVMIAELEASAGEIMELTSQLSAARQRQQKIQTQLLGIEQVLVCR